MIKKPDARFGFSVEFGHKKTVFLWLISTKSVLTSTPIISKTSSKTSLLESFTLFTILMVDTGDIFTVSANRGALKIVFSTRAVIVLTSSRAIVSNKLH